MNHLEIELPNNIDLSIYSHCVLRKPVKGDIFLNSEGDIQTAEYNWAQGKIVLIPKYKYPEWLGGAGIVKTSTNVWIVCSQKPELAFGGTNLGDVWTFEQDETYCQINIKYFPMFVPPLVSDWRNSWTPNPRYREE